MLQSHMCVIKHHGAPWRIEYNFPPVSFPDSFRELALALKVLRILRILIPYVFFFLLKFSEFAPHGPLAVCSVFALKKTQQSSHSVLALGKKNIVSRIEP